MADFNDVISELKSSNAEENQRDSRRLNQATSHNQDQALRFEALNQAISGVSNPVDTPVDTPEPKEPEINRGAQEEIEKEKLAGEEKDRSLLQKIAGGIGGILGNMKDKALAAGKGLMSILKGTLFAGLFILLAKFFQSPMFGQVIDFLTETILPGLITVGKFFMALGTRFIEAFSNIQVEFDKVFGPNKTLSERFSGFLGLFKEGGIIAAGLAGIVLLLKPSLLFGALKLGIKAFKAALAFAGVGISNQAADLKKSKTRGGKKGGLLSKAANLVPKNIGSKAATLGKGLLKGAKFLPGVGLAVTGIMGVFDGVSAGFKEYNAGGDAGDVAREAAAGVVSGLTFGLVSQETISGAFTTIGDKFKTGFDKMKEDTLAGVDKLKDLGVSAKEKLKDVAGGLKEKFDNVSEKVGGFFGDIKGKFSELTSKLPSIKDVGSKIGNFFGFGKKEEKEMAAPLVQFQKERTALVDRIAMLEKRIAEGPNTIRRNVDRNRLRMREKQLEELDKSAIARSMGGDAASTNVVAPQAKVTNNTANTNISSSSAVSNPDPTLQFAFS